MAKLLSLPDCAQAIAYQQIVAALRADPTIGLLVPEAQWTTHLEDATVKRNTGPDCNGLPAVRIMPFSAGVTPEAQTIQNSAMGLAITATTAGHDVRDIMNFWYALTAPVFTGDGNKTLTDSIRTALRQASIDRGGINIGSLQTIRLGMPAIGPSADSLGNKFMVAEGLIHVEMTVPR
ncbi:hypothetical protein [Singulisphaera acidiphila]|uniref:Uncharacterized protein n=1 Tax=Singulisphaera acidiphila (strain ATCC BAA-1392 / DSM 18658 / VKM B-2454 / MOB10) TaxID=886293 RepID=L0DHV6_SINAD|nr:hypothetical protein [Singulisphaera acidiphila]AGA28383.1 hypothetical protein Sinac_4176 [Singulisphaera acidiphila DSM 18658]